MPMKYLKILLVKMAVSMGTYRAGEENKLLLMFIPLSIESQSDLYYF